MAFGTVFGLAHGAQFDTRDGQTVGRSQLTLQRCHRRPKRSLEVVELRVDAVAVTPQPVQLRVNPVEGILVAV